MNCNKLIHFIHTNEYKQLKTLLKYAIKTRIKNINSDIKLENRNMMYSIANNIKQSPKMLYFSHGSTDLSQTFRFCR